MPITVKVPANSGWRALKLTTLTHAERLTASAQIEQLATILDNDVIWIHSEGATELISVAKGSSREDV
jgi:hypothetical protein